MTLTKDGFAERMKEVGMKEVEPTAETLTAFDAAESGKLQIASPRLMIVNGPRHDALALLRRLVDAD